MTDGTQAAWQCPRDGTAMTPLGRRSGAWRCPSCRSIFIDMEAMRRGRPSWWSPILKSVVISLLARAVVRHLRQRSTKQSPS